MEKNVTYRTEKNRKERSAQPWVEDNVLFYDKVEDNLFFYDKVEDNVFFYDKGRG